MPIDSLPPPLPLALRVLLRRICLTPFGCAYTGAPIEAALAAKKVEPQINEKGTRGHPLTEGQKAGNREKSRTRARVEHVFAQMSGSMKALYQRCIGLPRNAACLMLTNLVYNMLRFEQIKRLKLNAAA